MLFQQQPPEADVDDVGPFIDASMLGFMGGVQYFV